MVSSSYGPTMLVWAHVGAYGRGFEYAYTMVHEAPQLAKVYQG